MNGQIFEIELLGNHICYIWCSDTKLTVNEIQNTVSNWWSDNEDIDDLLWRLEINHNNSIRTFFQIFINEVEV